MRVAQKIVVTEEERVMLERWKRGRTTPARLVLRATIVLLAADGQQNREIALHLGIMPRTVSRWRTRFAAARLTGIKADLPRSGGPATARQRLEPEIVRMTTQEKPANATHWSTRSLAKALGTNESMVRRVWRAKGFKPHLSRPFKVSTDPHFEEKLRDVVGLYLNPPENALVLRADEKTQCQALDRSQPSLPMVKGRCGTMTHDYKRNGTTTLFAAIEMAQGKVIATTMKRHRHQEWIAFLKQIDAETPPDLDLHVIADNLATHKHPKVNRRLARHPRFHMHFTPTSSSWANMIERFFRELSEKRLKRGVFRSVPQLEQAIMDFVAVHNENPKPLVWRAPVDKILEKVGRAKGALIKAQQHDADH